MSEESRDSVALDIENDSRDSVTLKIHKMLDDLPPTCHEHPIVRVHDQLRKQNPDAYEPRAIAIGPYHRGKKHLQVMEERKRHYLKQFLHRRNETSVDRFVKAMRDLEQRAREAYAESIDLSEDEFVEMMLLDGCFISHFLRKYTITDIQKMDPDDPLFKNTIIRDNILQDLILFENQLPFFVVEMLIDMTRSEDWPADNIMDLALGSLGGLLPSTTSVPELPTRVSTKNTHHILGFIHGIWCSSFAAEVVSQRNEGNPQPAFRKCTTKLREAGIRFKVSSKWLDIKFSSGKWLSSRKWLKIPPLRIDHSSEGVLRNLIAYEQYSSSDQRYVSDFIHFLHYNLINSTKDVEQLRKNRIIVNWLGDDEVVATMFNNLCNQVMLSNNYSYYEVSNKVNRHCNNCWNRFKATLWRNHLPSYLLRCCCRCYCKLVQQSYQSSHAF